MTPNNQSPSTTHQGTNPHAAQPTSLVALGKSLWRNRQLIVQMTKREVVGRYKGSAMGVAWSLFNPVFMLVVYTFVFSEIFKIRWGGIGGDESKTQFALMLFVGMIVLSLFSEVLNSSARIDYSKRQLRQKSGISRLKYCLSSAMGAALFHSLISLECIVGRLCNL